MNQIHKYPRTAHIRGSRLQAGDEDLADLPVEALAGRHVVVEEKMDGSNSAISFGEGGKLLLQSRGHYLSGGPRERQFDLLKTWANAFAHDLWQVLGQRYVMYGEWLYAKHTVYYNALRHYFLEFDILDLAQGEFLDTPRRQALLRDLPMVRSVRVLAAGPAPQARDLDGLMGPSEAIAGAHIADLRTQVAAAGLRVETVVAETDPEPRMEGLYLKVEEGGRVVERYKFVRGSFVQAVVASESHWMDRPIVPNRLQAGVDIFHR